MSGIIKNIKMLGNKSEASSPGIPLQGASSSSKTMEAASRSGIPPQGAGGSTKPMEGT
jgi:hypothetical protein